jgi:outer membrane receptor protein involved in Fe transport
LIERYKIAETTYTYDNVDKGRIRGVELEWEVFPWTGLSIFGNFLFIDGKSLKTDAPLNDIPPQRFFLGARTWVGRFSLEVSGAWQQKKGSPGPAEIAIPSAEYANLKASFFLAPAVHIFLTLNNLFDESYLARPDPEAMPEPGRSLLFGLSYSF